MNIFTLWFLYWILSIGTIVVLFGQSAFPVVLMWLVISIWVHPMYVTMVEKLSNKYKI